MLGGNLGSLLYGDVSVMVRGNDTCPTNAIIFLYNKKLSEL